VPRRLAHFDSDNECIGSDDHNDYDVEEEEEEKDDDIEELPSPSKSPDISRLRNRRRGNQSSCHEEQRSDDFSQFYCRRPTENRP